MKDNQEDLVDITEFEEVDEVTTVYILGDFQEFVTHSDLFNYKLEDCSWYTQVKPPLINPDEVAIFDKEKSRWSVYPDHRGKIVYDQNGKPSIVDYIGDIKEGFSLKSPFRIPKKAMVDQLD